ncbi:hypothetical protein ACRAWD_22125 [Caulobacter segnis]
MAGKQGLETLAEVAALLEAQSGSRCHASAVRAGAAEGGAGGGLHGAEQRSLHGTAAYREASGLLATADIRSAAAA